MAKKPKQWIGILVKIGITLAIGIFTAGIVYKSVLDLPADIKQETDRNDLQDQKLTALDKVDQAAALERKEWITRQEALIEKVDDIKEVNQDIRDYLLKKKDG